MNKKFESRTDTPQDVAEPHRDKLPHSNVELADALSGAFHTKEEARALLRGANFPSSMIVDFSSPTAFWMRIMDEASNGAFSKDGALPILRRAALRYPGHPIFSKYTGKVSIIHHSPVKKRPRTLRWAAFLSATLALILALTWLFPREPPEMPPNESSVSDDTNRDIIVTTESTGNSKDNGDRKTKNTTSATDADFSTLLKDARSCEDIRRTGTRTDGTYKLNLQGTTVDVWCSFQKDGAWALLQRTVWDDSLIKAFKTNYSLWKEATLGSPSDLSVSYRLSGKHWDDLLRKAEIKAVVIPLSDKGPCQSLVYLVEGQELTIGTDDATLPGRNDESTPLVLGSELKTTDSGSSTACVNARTNSISWFYKAGSTNRGHDVCCSICPGFHDPEAYFSGPLPRPMFPRNFKDSNGRTAHDVCGEKKSLVEPDVAMAKKTGTVMVGAKRISFYAR